MRITRARNIPVFVGLVVLGATLVLQLGAVRSHAAVSSNLNAYVHDDASIDLTYADGTDVGSQGRTPPTIPAGTYTIHVLDDTSEHDFHIMGPGVNMQTDVGGSETDNWTVTFQPGGSYRFQCDEHPDFMWAAFVASGTATGGSGSSGSGSSGSSGSGSSGGTSSGTTGTKSTGGTTSSTGTKSSLVGTLVGTVNATGKVTLTWGGIPVKSLKPGHYKVTVADKTKAKSFVLQEKGHAAKTIGGVAFVGAHSLTLSLTAGTWQFYATGATKKSAFKVT
ncbi:MAG TPA: hypothetical protein VGL76_05615 [Gaiellaceae bacterium]|jgi:hypothetical protein